MKKVNVAGTATKMLLARRKVFPVSAFCSFEKANTMRVKIGRETTKPPKTGLVFESHKTKDRRIEVSATFVAISGKSPPS